MAKTERIEFRVSKELLGRIDEARGDVSRSRWIERSLQTTLADVPERRGRVVEPVSSVRRASPLSPAMARQARLNEARYQK